MEAAIRWSTYRGREPRFLIADAAGSRLRYCEVTSISGKTVGFEQISQLEKLPDFTAFDWSRSDENLVAIGTTNGESKIVKLDAHTQSSTFVHSFPVKQQRECNSIAFGDSSLLACALKKHRTDFSLNVYDLGDPSPNAEPFRRLASGDAVANVKFFRDEADIMLAGIYGKGLRLYDLRDPNTAGAAFISTRQCHFLSIDPLDENYFASAGPPGENIVNVWDRRAVTRSTASLSSPIHSNAVLEISDPIDAHRQTTIRTLRFSGSRRGRFAVLSSAGQLRLFDFTRHPPHSDPDPLSNERVGRELDDTFHYLKQSQNLQYPWFDKYHGQEESLRAVAFDFASPGTLIESDSIISIRRNTMLEIIPILPPPALVKLTAVNDMAFHEQSSYAITSPHRRSTIAEDMLDIQAKIRQHTEDPCNARTDDLPANGTAMEQLHISVERTRMDDSTGRLSSRQRHDDLLNVGLPTTALNITDMLTVLDVHRRRCEEGYLFNCELNKEIVKNDPWLVELWDVVKRMEAMADDGGMMHEALDLSFMGANDIWTADIDQTESRVQHPGSLSESEFEVAIQKILSRHDYGKFEGITTQFPERRQLGLAICGWRFSERKLRTKCIEILNRGDHYKSIVVAFCHGRKRIAIDMLKAASRAGSIENSGLAAVIACDSVSKEQRSLCEWMAEDARDPYLKALLTYFITGDWKSVADMTALPLLYRVAVALKHLDDDTLSQFLKAATADAIKHGDTEGVVLTGLGSDSMELFQNYIDRTNDLQTAVLVTAFTNPRYIEDERWQMWQETYFLNMQSWKAFMQRTRFTVQHSRKSIDRNGQTLVRPPPRQITLRCNHCQKSIAKPVEPQKRPAEIGAPAKLLGQTSRPQNPSAAAGTVCPRCGRHLPRCSICMLWLGTPDASTPNGAAAAAALSEDPMAKFINFCMSCGHGFHANHAMEWFRKHQICPVPDCHCMCAQRR